MASYELRWVKRFRTRRERVGRKNIIEEKHEMHWRNVWIEVMDPYLELPDVSWRFPATILIQACSGTTSAQSGRKPGNVMPLMAFCIVWHCSGARGALLRARSASLAWRIAFSAAILCLSSSSSSSESRAFGSVSWISGPPFAMLPRLKSSKPATFPNTVISMPLTFTTVPCALWFPFAAASCASTFPFDSGLCPSCGSSSSEERLPEICE